MKVNKRNPGPLCCCCWIASVVSDSVWPHRQQPTRLLCSWDFPGKNTGVGCHFLLQCMKVKNESEVVFDSSWPHGLQPTRLLCPWDFPGKSTRVGCHCLLHQDPLESAYLRQIKDPVSGTPLPGMQFHLLHGKEKGPGWWLWASGSCSWLLGK